MATKRKFRIKGPLIGPNSWLASHPEIFRSEQSFRWWFRRHKERLVNKSAVVRLRDQWHHTDLMDDEVSRIASEEAKSKLQQAA